MFHHQSVSNRRILSASQVVIAAALVVVYFALATPASGLAAPALKVQQPLFVACVSPMGSLVEVNNTQSTNTNSCTVSSSESLTAFEAMKASNAAVPASISQAALESMSLRNAKR